MTKTENRTNTLTPDQMLTISNRCFFERYEAQKLWVLHHGPTNEVTEADMDAWVSGVIDIVDELTRDDSAYAIIYPANNTLRHGQVVRSRLREISRSYNGSRIYVAVVVTEPAVKDFLAITAKLLALYMSNLKVRFFASDAEAHEWLAMCRESLA